MIIDIPSAEDYRRSALNQLNLACDIGFELTRHLRGLDDLWSGDSAMEIAPEYWKAAQPVLANGLTLVQQAQEFALKGRIAAVSPFLLISSDARDWPAHSDKKDVPFSAFRTTDAADLLRVHDTVAPASERLPLSFRGFFDEVRRQRNVIMHHGYSGQKIDVAELFVANQHYVPKMLLRNFAPDGVPEKVFVFDKHTQKVWPGG